MKNLQVSVLALPMATTRWLWEALGRGTVQGSGPVEVVARGVLLGWGESRYVMRGESKIIVYNRC